MQPHQAHEQAIDLEGTGSAKPCPACHDIQFVRFLNAGALSVWRCVRCGLGQTIPPPPESDGWENFAEDPAHFTKAYAQPKDR